MTKPESAGYDYDVVISGASLAGSAAAILLARRGVRIALLERYSDPEAHKVLCTHSLTANAYPGWTNSVSSPLSRRREPSATRPAGIPAGDGSSRGPRLAGPELP
ncbi:FAD-dependent monooxygenase [Streptomyces sioyaensis]|uniref:FAD-dependent monooxygenase n=1 Tax=Streptomyces sioyaensis TaxID=67364 RepID=UPI0033D30E1F